MSAAGEQLDRLVEIMARLRADCPWDREQDIRSMRPYLIEEAFEVVDEMDRVAQGGPWRALCEEHGDLLFQIVFHARIAEELGEYSMADVSAAISDKLTSRHPHVFGEKQADGTGGTILGVHMVGPWVTEQLGQGYLAVNWGATVDEVASLIQPHPTLSELFGETVLSLTGRSLHG